MRRIVVAVATAAVICSVTWLSAQSSAAPAFEVASVRLNPQSNTFSSQITDTRVDITLPLRWLLLRAFRVEDYQLAAPEWLNETFVDIHATLPFGASRRQVPEMLQRLLAERFGLAAHREVRSMDGYELVVGPEGVKMREVEPIDELHKEFPPDPALNGRARRDATTETPEGAVRTISTPRGFRTVTSRTSYERTVVPGGGGIIDAARMTMTELVPWLWENLDRPVVDKTGLPGVYEFKIELPRDARGDRVFQSLGVNTTALPPSGGPSTMKAVEELGLKLERRQLPIEVIVVDKIAREPTAN